jgi:UDP-N-acetylglucosamine 2-epimerase
MNIVTVVGARPQFIKAAPVSEALHEHGHIEFLLHTGQHYDANMSEVFFEELGIPKPNFNLNVGSGSHASQTAAILTGVEKVLLDQKPDWLLIYGDTNSTLAAALAASKLDIPIAHVEAGLRSFNRCMPEEINRVISDHLSSLLFCPSQTAKQNLANEGITAKSKIVGDVMYDALKKFIALADEKSGILDALKLENKGYYLATVHRAENTDDASRLREILDVLTRLDKPTILPLHPRTRARIRKLGLEMDKSKLVQIAPLGYLDMLILQKNALAVLTDSGGMQKEAYWLGVPCITLREETEWLETIQSGWNVLTGTDSKRIITATLHMRDKPPISEPVLAYTLPGKSASIRIAESFETK